jgi:hypothetical protein
LGDNENLPPLGYDPSNDDDLFQTLELRQRSQQHDIERVFRDAGVSRDTDTLERTELVDGCLLASNGKGLPSPIMLQAVLAKLTPFPKEVIVTGLQQFTAQYCCVCRSKPVAVSVSSTRLFAWFTRCSSIGMLSV